MLLWLSAAGASAQLPQAEVRAGGLWLPFGCRTLDSYPNYTSKPANLVLSKYGGWKARRIGTGTGFFRVEKIDGRWWAIDPEGYLFIHMALNSVNLDHQTPDQIYAMMREHGFNGFGSWTDETIVSNSTLKAQTPMAYTPKISMLASYRQTRVPRIEMPVFDDAFETSAMQQAQGFAPYVNDPHVFGYMTDNELSFNYDGLAKHLAITDPADKNYTTAIAFLTDRGKTPATWGQSDHEAYMALMAERYYSVVKNAIRSVDTNHMIIGSRCHSAERQVKDFMINAGKYVDVFSTNHYHRWSNRSVETKNMSEWSGRPLMLTEFYTKGDDTAMLDTGAGWYVRDQTSRARFYQNFISTFTESKHVIGFHWFKYMDGDNNCGVVSPTGAPYTELLNSMKQMNTGIYDFIDYIDRRHAPDTVLGPEADAYFDGGTNKGTNPELRVKYATSSSFNTFRQTYLRFNVSALSGPIDSAILRLNSIDANSESGSYQAELVTNDTWGETTIDSGNRPAGSTVLGTWSEGGDVIVDVTSVLAEAVATDGKLSIRIISTLNNGSIPEYGAREHSDPAARPQLMIYGTNAAPAASSDLYATPKNTAMVVAAPGVLGNDSDTESDPLSAVLVTPPASGSLVLNSDGSFSYTPANNFTGTTSFTYKTNDGEDNSAIVTVSLNIQTAFETWAAQGGGSVTFINDLNHDGVADGLAWLLGATHPTQTAAGLLPPANVSNGKLSISFQNLKAAARGSATLDLQYSKDLGITDPWESHTIAVPETSSTDPSGVVFVITTNGDMNQVQATLPAAAAGSGGKVFVRLKAQLPTP